MPLVWMLFWRVRVQAEACLDHLICLAWCLVGACGYGVTMIVMQRMS